MKKRESGNIMAYQVIDLTCPGCGAKLSIDQKRCEYCDSPVLISSFNTVYSMPAAVSSKYLNAYNETLANSPDAYKVHSAAGMCHLKLKRYAKALESFEKAIDANIDNSETYFYAAVCLLDGKKAFMQQRSTIDKVLTFINAAILLEPRGIYYYFLAYIKYDYFERKYLNTTPNYKSCLNTALDYGVSVHDKQMLFDILGVAAPSCL